MSVVTTKLPKDDEPRSVDLCDGFETLASLQVHARVV